MNGQSFLLFDMAFQQSPTKAFSPTLEIPSLSFDRVHSGHFATSAFPLFQLPVELFAGILNYLSNADIMALSLVDRDCRRLALLSSFKDVKFWFAPDKTIPLLGPLVLASGNHPHITPCIRRVSVTPDPSKYHIPNHAILVTEYNTMSLQKTEDPLASFVNTISKSINNSLPNLHVVDWDMPVVILSTTLNSILMSPAKHVRLDGTIVHEDEDATSIYSELSLETLSLNVAFTAPSFNGPRHFFDDLLRRTHSTLRQLRWAGNATGEDIHISTNAYQFRCLRSLTLDSVSPNSEKIVEHLLGPHTQVETLAMDTLTSSTSSFFDTKGYMSSLKSFCWLIHKQGDTAPYDTIIEFLKNNVQLEALHIPGPASPSFLSESLLPTLSQHFTALNSLHLVWSSSDIDDEALEALANIKPLRCLWLSAGNQDGLRNTWEVDHKAIITRLSPLKHLETLAFSHDTYAVNAHPLAPRACDYYASKALPVDLDLSQYLSPAEFDMYQGKNVDFHQGMTQQIEMRRTAWETWHAERMIAVGNQYRVVLPSLRWMFVGQLVMSSARSRPFELDVQPPQREPCLSSLQRKMSMTLWRPV